MAQHELRTTLTLVCLLQAVVAEPMNLSFLSTLDAVCNDGTPAGFYMSEGSNPHQWVVFLEGGGWCTDEDSCLQRAKSTHLTSSSSWQTSIVKRGGIWDRQRGSKLFQGTANHVFVPYCSSDAWAGDSEGVDHYSSPGWHFKGSRIVSAVFDELETVHGLNPASDSVLFMGCSAGSRGVMFNADRIAQRIPNLFVVLDSAWWIPVQPLPQGSDLVRQAQQAYKLHHPRLNQQCVYGNPGSEWRCYFAERTLAYTNVSTLSQAFLFDSFQLSQDTGTHPPFTGDVARYVDEFRDTLKHSLNTTADGHKGVSVFAPSCYMHCSGEREEFHSLFVGGVSLSHAVERFITSVEADVRIQECATFNCGCS